MQSHGEAFLNVLNNRLTGGLFLPDEPEAALSSQRLLALLAIIQKRTKHQTAQFIIVTHSPILLTFPKAIIINFDTPDLTPIDFKETQHYKITKDLLEHPEAYWRHLT